LLSLNLPKLTAAADYSVRVAIGGPAEDSADAEPTEEATVEATAPIANVSEQPEAVAVPADDTEDVWSESV